jgi:hypothetical protein
MSRKRSDLARPEKDAHFTEEDLQARFKDDASPLVQKLLAARREFVRENGRFQTQDEILAEIAARRGENANQ